jgi:hypothetical protein
VLRLERLPPRGPLRAMTGTTGHKGAGAGRSHAPIVLSGTDEWGGSSVEQTALLVLTTAVSALTLPSSNSVWLTSGATARSSTPAAHHATPAC